jgi:hypothetical protein
MIAESRNITTTHKIQRKNEQEPPKKLKDKLNDFDKTKKELQLGKPKHTRQNMHEDI